MQKKYRMLIYLKIDNFWSGRFFKLYLNEM